MKTRSATRALIALSLVAGMSACSPSSESDPDEVPGGGDGTPGDELPEGTPTYHSDIAPIMDAQCSGCHSEGGIGPFQLDTFESLSPLAQVSLDSMRRGSMPPWMPNPECNEFVGQRILTPEQLETFEAWVEAGTPEGDPALAREAEADEAPERRFEPTHVVSIDEGYMADTRVLDDYRCFILDLELEEDSYLTASQVLPGDDQIVHHVLVYAVDDGLMPQLRAADEAEPGPGYTCFGSPYPENFEATSPADQLPNQISAWVPGLEAAVFREDTAIRVPKNSKVVMQVHYNLLNDQQIPDQTELRVRLTEEKPEYLNVTTPLPILDFQVPAGEERSVWTRGFTNYTNEPIEIISMAPHMHTLGSEFRARVIRDGEETGECMLEIPEWDFSWQQSYVPKQGEEIVLQPGDQFEIECVYDNSPSNQPIIDGEQAMPQRVEWGEGTFDEMCLLYIGIREPFSEPAEGAGDCNGEAAACAASCGDEPTLGCLLSCEEANLDCNLCVVEKTVECGTPCLAKILPIRECMTHCTINTLMLGGTLGACVESECGDGYAEYAACVDGEYADGVCDEGLAACGLEL